jgi:hypothetical protein
MYFGEEKYSVTNVLVRNRSLYTLTSITVIGFMVQDHGEGRELLLWNIFSVFPGAYPTAAE